MTLRKTFALLVLATTSTALGQVPTLINYQGRLLNGTNLYSGTSEIVFRLYNTNTFGLLLYEDSNSTVTVSDGLYSTYLGDQTTFGSLATALTNTEVWLQIRVDGQVLSPRERLTGVAYSMLSAGVATGGITTAMLADNAVTGAKITDGAVSGTDLADGTISNADLAAGAVNSSSIADGQVSAADVQASSFSNTFWKIDGNAGTTPGTHYLGTSDTNALVLAVNGRRVFYASPADTTRIILGHPSNSVDSLSANSVIGGGGSPSNRNIIANADSTTIGGGISNTVNSADGGTIAGGAFNSIMTIGGGGVPLYSTISGGRSNTVGGQDSAIGGGRLNIIYSGSGMTIGGGVSNVAYGSYDTVGGGRNNLTTNTGTTVAGGENNTAGSLWATVGGGGFNTADGIVSFIGGGSLNSATDDWAVVTGGDKNHAGFCASVGGGTNNRAGGWGSVVAGGYNNEAAGDSSTIGGGDGNVAQFAATVAGGFGNDANANYSTIGGGFSNTASGRGSFIGGGSNNTAAGSASIIGGGARNSSEGNFASVGGGQFNSATGTHAAIGGGYSNIVDAASSYGAIPGGYGNRVAGGYSLAAGRRANAIHDGTFVWADEQGAVFSSTTNSQFAVRSSNGVWVASQAGDAKAVPFGVRYEDNVVVAWAKVPKAGTLLANESFNVQSVTNSAEGRYDIVLLSAASSSGELIPVATPEIDTQPTSALTVRFIAIDQVNTTRFQVYINNGNFAPTNNDFTFIVTGRR